MFTGEALPEDPLTANAYLGARPIATALDLGADIVVTGRCADSAVVLGPLMHELGWSETDHDLLAAGSLIGHLLECGPQVTGGLFTDWREVPGWDDMGYPVAECAADGTAVITKPAGTGGLVTPATVGEQLLYEIADPGAYVLPDVVCDWRDVRLEQDGPDRVRVSGARGSAPTATYKTTVTALDGYRFMATASFFGLDADGRARRAGEAVLARAERILGAPLRGTSLEVLGSPSEALVKIAAHHDDAPALELLAREIAPMALVAQGMTGFTGGRPKPQPLVRLFHTLVDKAEVPVAVVVDDQRHEVAATTQTVATPPATEPLPEIDAPTPAGATVPLREIAYARSGDKGNDANIGVLARSPEHYDAIRSQVTAARVRELFGDWLQGDVRRYELPGIHAINIVLTDVLGGRGGTSSLRLDPQGKSYAAMLLALEVSPAEGRGGSRGSGPPGRTPS
jgi:hypothetical protein